MHYALKPGGGGGVGSAINTTVPGRALQLDKQIAKVIHESIIDLIIDLDTS